MRDQNSFSIIEEEYWTRLSLMSLRPYTVWVLGQLSISTSDKMMTKSTDDFFQKKKDKLCIIEDQVN